MTKRAANRLLFEKSPYLLQHAYNPVDWHPWGAAAFAKAAREEKPVFLSIGYSTCHWCHVMERESFEDPEVAQLLNETFVCIKVDREERPDIDRIYMRVCQLMTGSGGWPLTILLLPDKRPFFAATYIPRESRFGRMGMRELIPRVKEAWSTRRDDLERAAEKSLVVLRRGATESGLAQGEDLDATTVDAAYLALVDAFDERYGGFGRAPKFPSPHRLRFLLRYWKRTGKEQARRMVEQTLQAMRRGGIYDHVGFGFHRYATDRQWHVPHFEKMLYDQAMLAMAYVEAYQALGNEEDKETACEILTYILRDLTDPTGGFYSAEDADVAGEEGQFYLWTADEIRQWLPTDQADLVRDVFNMEKNGNFEEGSTRRKTGKNILHRTTSLKKLADEQNVPLAELTAAWERARETLFTARERRAHPHKDDKILADWNGLMIAALAKASRIVNEDTYVDAATGAVQFIDEHMRDSQGRLFHRYRDGEAAIPGFLNDYAFLVWGLIELYETTFDVKYLQHAIALTDEMIHRFWDDEHGSFYFTADDAENVLVRDKEIDDGAYPSGNAVAALNLLHLARMTGNPAYEAKAAQIFQTFTTSISQAPAAHSHVMIALEFIRGPAYEVVVVGDRRQDDTNNMLNVLKRLFIPNKVVLFRPAHEERPEIARYAEFTNPLSSIEGKATAYVCRNYECHLPTTNIDEMLRLLDATA
ncbi:thioredoxin [miscellaneous Crenarchaeota group archaeon SMTZ1-55]|nr:MAG: thioredoxin [miscellaneous Crenarchaeota group archaeon SMTZ1-55]